MAAARAVTELLENWRSGDKGALDELTPLVYEELRRLARRYMRSERAGHTLQATGLVNEAFIRLAGMDVQWADRAHFYAVAARSMRRILIDHAKAWRRDKRGGGVRPATLHEAGVAGQLAAADDLLAIDEALARLAEIDPRKSDVLVLHFFGGMTYDETAEALGVSTATVHRDLRLGRAWLLNELA
ncbi:MAG: sigma-70 family RNA polymerase sigma factor [Woeseia sp.]